MVNKLRFGEERILDQVIAKLETAAALYKRNNISAAVFFGLDGVLYSMPVSDILAAAASAVLIVLTYRRLSSESV